MWKAPKRFGKFWSLKPTNEQFCTTKPNDIALAAGARIVPFPAVAMCDTQTKKAEPAAPTGAFGAGIHDARLYANAQTIAAHVRRDAKPLP